jgi:hypothetical protein
MSIIAGDVLWRIGGDTKNLQSAMGQARKAVGVAMTAAGAAITGFAVKGIFDFANLADELDKMSLRTGFSTNALGELKFAAEQSGASLGDIERSSKNLSKQILDLEKGSGALSENLGRLGLDYDTLSKMTPEQQFMEVAFAIADVDDASTRAALAANIFGRAGTQLLPMLANGRAGLQSMREEAIRLGYSLGPEQAKMGAQFKDVLQQMEMALGSLSMDVAQVLIPILVDMMTWVKEAAISFKQWRDENPGLFQALTKLTVVLGLVMSFLGPLLLMLPGIATAFAAVKATVIAVGAVLAVLTGPIGLIIGAIALLGAAAWYFVDDWGAVWETVKSVVGSAVEFIVDILTIPFKMIGALMDVSRYLGDRVGSMLFGVEPVGLATGGTVKRSGWAMVGERGPELVQMPRGATVYDAGQTERATQGAGGGNTYTLNFGRDSVRSDEDIREIERSLSRVLHGDLMAMGVRA